MKKNIISLVGSAAAVLALATSAQAVATDSLRYSFDDGATWTTITDGGAGDFAVGTDGLIGTVITAGGGFTLTVIGTGTTKPLVGSAAHPVMDLGMEGGGTGIGKLIVEFSDIGFGPIPTGAYLTTLTANNTGIPVTTYTVIGANSLFSGANIVADVPTGPQVITTLGPTTVALTSGTGTAPGQSDPYSITLVQVFDLNRNGGHISTDQSLVVPDGGNTLMLLGSALSVLGLGVFRSSRKAAVKA